MFYQCDEICKSKRSIYKEDREQRWTKEYSGIELMFQDELSIKQKQIPFN
jgi:hypothetical protein